MFKQRMMAIALMILTVVMVAISSDATIALLTIPMSVLLIFKKVEEEEQNG